MALLPIRGCLSRIRIFFIPDPGSASKNLSILTPKKLFLNSRKYDPGCSSRIWILTLYPSRIPGSKRRRIPDPDPQHWLKVYTHMHMKRLRLKGAHVGTDVFVALVGVGEKGGEGRRNGGRRFPPARRRLSAQPLFQVVQLLLNCLLLQE